MPIILGDGPMFFDRGQEQALHLKDVTAYKSGMVELWYELRKEQECFEWTETNTGSDVSVKKEKLYDGKN